MNHLRLLFTLSLLFAVSCAVWAVPAKPGLVVFRQADGTEIMVRIIGDERAHYYLTEDGYLLLNDADRMYYARLDAAGRVASSGLRATAPARRTAAEKAFLATVSKGKMLAELQKEHAAAPRRAPRRNVGLFDTGFPSKGRQKALVVLVQYTDVKFQSSYDPHGYFSRMLHEDGFSDYGGTGCVEEYFRQNSMGQFLPEFDLYGPITLAHDQAYYGGNDWSGNDQNAEQMAIEACQILDDSIDFREYDRDRDGSIDNIYIFYAGRGEADGGSKNTVWPHSWNIAEATSTVYKFDGVRLDRYGCSNEWNGRRPDGIGTFVHEFSHVLGLPDLYTTSYTTAFTPGAWSVLDYGPYNNDGCTPPAYSVYERYSLDWITPRELSRPENITLDTITTNDACIVRTGKANEFFLFENRQQSGWDRYIPGHGMLVWHVDFDQSVWESNKVNDTSSHQYVDLEEADGTQTDGSRAGDAFPGMSRKTSFTDTTTPSMKSWDGSGQQKPITDISESRGLITFKVCGGKVAPDSTTALPAVDVRPAGFTARWKASPDSLATGYALTVYTLAPNGSHVLLDRWNARPVGDTTAVRVDSLEPATTYIYKVYVAGEAGLSDASNEISVRTAEPTFDYLAPRATAARDITAHSFTATWEELPTATAYTVEAYAKQLGEPERLYNGFDAGIKSLDGWTTNTTQTYANTAYSGDSIPALRFGADGRYVQSPVMDKDIHTLTFWHRGNKASDAGRLIVLAGDKAGKWTLIDSLAIENAAPGTTTTLNNIPEGTRQVRIELSLKGSGSVAIDDIELLWGGKLTRREEQTIDAGAMLTATVQGLRPDTKYYYRVRATSGTVSSKYSGEIEATTLTEEAMGINAPGTRATGPQAPGYDAAGRRATHGLIISKGRKKLKIKN